MPLERLQNAEKLVLLTMESHLQRRRREKQGKQAEGGIITLQNGGFIANGCGVVRENRRKKTRIF